MLSLHYNGDIVNTPDKETAYLLELRRRRIKKVCKYGKYESDCPVWQNCVKCWQNIKRKNQQGRCELSKKICCPARMQCFINGLKKKKYKITYPVYRKLASATHHLIKTSEHKVLFLTLTFPKYKEDAKFNKLTETDQNNYRENQANESFSKFVENMRTNYKSSGYIAVRERGEKTNRLHFHLLISLPFISFVDLNRCWLHTISGYCEYSDRALYSDKKNRFITSPIQAIKYVCKYFSKVRAESDTKIYFISNNLIIKALKFTPEDSFKNTGLFFDRYRCEVVSQSEYHTTYRACNPEFLKKMFIEIIYPLFGTIKKGVRLEVRDNNFQSDG